MTRQSDILHVGVSHSPPYIQNNVTGAGSLNKGFVSLFALAQRRIRLLVFCL